MVSDNTGTTSSLTTSKYDELLRGMNKNKEINQNKLQIMEKEMSDQEEVIKKLVSQIEEQNVTISTILNHQMSIKQMLEKLIVMLATGGNNSDNISNLANTLNPQTQNLEPLHKHKADYYLENCRRDVDAEGICEREISNRKTTIKT